jgi:hypothetical protein
MFLRDLSRDALIPLYSSDIRGTKSIKVRTCRPVISFPNDSKQKHPSHDIAGGATCLSDANNKMYEEVPCHGRRSAQLYEAIGKDGHRESPVVRSRLYKFLNDEKGQEIEEHCIVRNKYS